MADPRFDKALKAKAKIVSLLDTHPKVNSIGVGRDEGVYFISVGLLSALEPSDPVIADRVDGFEVRTRVIGVIRAL